jgi:hypothetical protein
MLKSVKALIFVTKNPIIEPLIKARTPAQRAFQRMGAFAGGGMAGLAAGAGIGLLGYGVYKGASALSEGVYKNKVEATETDKFKRSMGATSDAFDKLIQQSRMVGDAFLLSMQKEGRLGDTIGMFKKQGIDPEKVSDAGFTTMAEIAVDGKNKDGLDKIRTGLAGRADLTEPQKKQLEKLRGETDEGKLRDALMKFASTMEREKTSGEEIQRNTADIANKTQLMSDGLTTLSTKANSYLAALVTALAKDSPEAKAVAEAKRQVATDKVAEDISSGKVPAEKAKSLNTFYDNEAKKAQSMDPDKKQKRLMEIEAMRTEAFGDQL